MAAIVAFQASKAESPSSTMAKSKKSKKSKSSKKFTKPNRDATATATADQITGASSSTNQQVHTSLGFLQLPQEIRDEIYATIFCSTRFAFGERAFGRMDHRDIGSSAGGNALAILRTCRRVRNEIGVSWLHQVLFHFEDPESLLGKLARIPITLRNQIRHVRVSGHPLMVSWEDDDVYYRTAQVLKLLPGLELDTLTVLGGKDPQVSYDTLNMLIRYSDGWKELHYLSHTSGLLAYKDDMPSFGMSDPMANRYMRQPQPSDWQNALEQRDGQASHPSVVVYRATEVAAPGAVLQPTTRKIFTQAFATNQDAHTFGEVEDATLMRPEEIGKEVLVVAKRGAGVDYAEKEGSPYLSVGDIREDCPAMTWMDIKAQQDAMFKDDDDFDDSDDQSVVFMDTYSHVDEYTWPPLHFLTN